MSGLGCCQESSDWVEEDRLPGCTYCRIAPVLYTVINRVIGVCGFKSHRQYQDLKSIHMKKFLNVFTLVMGVIFILGLITTAMAGNWVAFIWVVIGFLWLGMSRGHEVQKEMLKEDYENRLTELRVTRDDYIRLYKEYSDRYDAKLKENYDLACHNKELIEVNLRLAKENQELGGKGSTLGTAPVEEHRGTHGNIKIKRKKKAVPEVKTDIQDKS